MSKNILLVEDNQEDARLTSRALSKNGISNQRVVLPDGADARHPA